MFRNLSLTILPVPSGSLHFIRLLASKKPQRPRLELCEDVAPAVDVFITCCGEDTGLILDTVRAACALNYPPHLIRVFVLDDGASAELSRAVNALRQSVGNLYHTARKKSPVKDYKAGNLNHGLELTKTLPGPAADIVAGLDADMIPEPEWLRRTIPHLMENRKMGLVNPPQVSFSCKPRRPSANSYAEFLQRSPRRSPPPRPLRVLPARRTNPRCPRISKLFRLRVGRAARSSRPSPRFPYRYTVRGHMLLIPPPGRWMGDCLYKCRRSAVGLRP